VFDLITAVTGQRFVSETVNMCPGRVIRRKCQAADSKARRVRIWAHLSRQRRREMPSSYARRAGLQAAYQADYALIAMKHLAIRPDAASASAQRLPSRSTSRSTDGQVLQRLARRGLVTSHQGTRGGYRLARPASIISAADIIQAIDGPLTVTACSTEAENCDQYAKCSVRDPLWRIRERIISALDTCSLQEISSDMPEMPLAGVAAPMAFTKKL
jgi:Rrf2 family protein